MTEGFISNLTRPEIHMLHILCLPQLFLYMFCELQMCDESLFPLDDILPINIQEMCTFI